VPGRSACRAPARRRANQPMGPHMRVGRADSVVGSKATQPRRAPLPRPRHDRRRCRSRVVCAVIADVTGGDAEAVRRAIKIWLKSRGGRACGQRLRRIGGAIRLIRDVGISSTAGQGACATPQACRRRASRTPCAKLRIAARPGSRRCRAKTGSARNARRCAHDSVWCLGSTRRPLRATAR